MSSTILFEIQSFYSFQAQIRVLIIDYFKFCFYAMVLRVISVTVCFFDLKNRYRCLRRFNPNIRSIVNSEQSIRSTVGLKSI